MRIDTKSRSDPLRRRLRRLGPGERREEAQAFIRLFHRENRLGDGVRREREAEITRALRRSGTYEHTPEELAFGARVAWRNHSRCIGRLFWKSLEVIDCRTVRDPDEVAARIVDHMALASGDGRIRSLITIFAPVRNNDLPVYVESAQVVQYAGYVDGAGSVIGDRQNVEATRIAMALGWRPSGPPGMFDVLPLVIRHRGRRLLYEVPPSVIREVDIVHPEYPRIAELGLCWYAVPCISGMIVTIGGLDYPCAPFNGFYMGTEIASRNLADENRYNLLAKVASAIGDAPDNDKRHLWKDRALLELNRAVLHSYDRAGVTIVDHHRASEQYMEFARHEHAAGRVPSGDWPWIVPPQASAACPVFHLPMRDLQAVPNFYRSRASDGGRLRPNYEHETRSRLQERWDRMKRRVRDWHRLHN
jgi:nitric-oxide synthase